jgi:hypothetical protein
LILIGGSMIKKIMIEQEDKNKLLNFKFERLNNVMKLFA